MNSVAATKGYELGELHGASNEFGMMMMLMMVLRLMMMVMMMVILMGVSNELETNAKYEILQIRPNKPIQCIWQNCTTPVGNLLNCWTRR